MRADGEFMGRIKGTAEAESERVLFELLAFRDRHSKALPEDAALAINELVMLRPILTNFPNAVRLTTASTLYSFKLAAVDYQLADRETRWRSLVERAFLHLDRLIVVDDDVSARWQARFKHEDEPACEALGGTHLLHHGLWGFKAHAPGERTDLVLRSPITKADIDRAAPAIEAMVLTEWKCVRKPDDLDALHSEAVHQLKQYGGGVMAGFELQSVRYAVTVANDRLETRPDEIDGRVTYRHIHIAVAPSTPSELSRKHGRGKRRSRPGARATRTPRKRARATGV